MGPEIMRAKPKSSMRLVIKGGCVPASELVNPYVVLAWNVLCHYYHLCLYAHTVTSCIKICKGHAVVNSLFTPASEAVLSVPEGIYMPCTDLHLLESIATATLRWLCLP